MINFKPKQSLTKKIIFFTVFIVCSLFICVKALAAKWGEDSCEVYYFSESKKIKIYYKFFEYDINRSRRNSFLERFEVKYSTDDGKTYKPLLSTSSSEQVDVYTWSCIKLLSRNNNEKINLLFQLNEDNKDITMHWSSPLLTKINVKNHLKFNNQTWLCVDWLQYKYKKEATQIAIEGIWCEYGVKPIKHTVMTYNIDATQKKEIAKLNPNCLNITNSSLSHKIKSEYNKNIINICKETNTMAIKGALSKKIQVYITTGKLVKSVVADCDIIQIPLPANQLYMVHVGEGRYKFAL